MIQNRLEKYKQTFNNSLTSEEVKSSSEDIFGRLANEKANGLEELRKIRLKAVIFEIDRLKRTFNGLHI